MICGTMYCCMSFSKAVLLSFGMKGRSMAKDQLHMLYHNKWHVLQADKTAFEADAKARAISNSSSRYGQQEVCQISGLIINSEETRVRDHKMGRNYRWGHSEFVSPCSQQHTCRHALLAPSMTCLPILPYASLHSLSMHQPESRLLGSTFFACIACKITVLACTCMPHTVAITQSLAWHQGDIDVECVRSLFLSRCLPLVNMPTQQCIHADPGANCMRS